MENVASVVSKTGSGVAITSGFGGWVSDNHELIWALGVTVGAVAAVGGLIIGSYYKHKANMREEEFHALQMEDLRYKMRDTHK